LALISADDHVAPPANADVILAGIGATDRLCMTPSRSFHAATIDFGRDVIDKAARAFFRKQIGR
jgi:esterase/lipase